MTEGDWWSLVDEAADALGVSKYAREKWRYRQSVPHKWQRRLVKQTEGKISLDAFDELKPRTAEPNRAAS